MGPDSAIAAVRCAVRAALAEVCGDAGGAVLVACSGGADSLALAAALAFEAPRAGPGAGRRRRGPGIPAGAITVDHGLQEGSAGHALQVVRTLRAMGLDPVESVAVTVGGVGGPEAAARRARYQALDDLAGRVGATAVLLGHTLDDQAETVLLGLARGSGARSLAGMPASFRRGTVRYLRPLLGLSRQTTRRACLAAGLEPWDDPHNDDPAFTRVRLRKEALPVLERTLGPGVAAALARTARMLGEDADALDEWAERAYTAATAAARAVAPAPALATATAPTAEPPTLPPAMLPPATAAMAGPAADGDAPHGDAPHGVQLAVAALTDLPAAVRTRVLRRAALAAGSPPGALGAVHIEAMDRLVTAWHGQARVDLPGRLLAIRRYGKLFLLSNTS